MIKIDIVLAISLYLCSSICLVFVLWMFYNLREGGQVSSDNLSDLQQCPYCTYVFFHGNKNDVLMCPQCQCYIDKRR
ncbi:MAG: hypothetical protein A3G91_00585 [Omnitrophica WOR_2 bacterium RIFCSPLOWO2_12_FULL_50_9]|nr:MAG: hypothetical protein A3D87_04500 [Omnitrophica WOR_2 bacterium RIFCSPHIGHO2_02_FULL_50_17]OGX42795.1 MAG: hypothetical protein A3G91_00585 [Omnitrophica WOR_2 bacterium RIFCSPLOWO2_12_FULL_50_9]